MEPVYLGVDGEMSGTEPSVHVLIQIGVAISGSDTFSSCIGWPRFDYDPAALKAIGVSPVSIKAGPTASEVDECIVEWLERRGVKGRKLVPVGWGVSYFDRRYIDSQLPRFAGCLHHHSVELNAVAYAMAGTCRYLGEARSFDEWKAMAKRMAQLHILNERGMEPTEHDALDDAVSALLSWRWMRSVIADQWRESRVTDHQSSLRG